MKHRKLSKLELALFLIPLLAVVFLALQGPLQNLWRQSSISRWSASLPFSNPEKVQMMEFSNDSKSLAVIYWKEEKQGGKLTGTGRLDVLDVATLEVKHSFSQPLFGTIKWSPKNDRIAIHDPRNLAVWDLKLEKKIYHQPVAAKLDQHIIKWRSQDVLEIYRSINTPQKDKWLKQNAIVDICTNTIKTLTNWQTESMTQLRFKDRSPNGRWLLYEARRPSRLEVRDAKTQRTLRTFKSSFHDARFLGDQTIAICQIRYHPFSQNTELFATTFKITDSRIRWRNLKPDNSIRYSSGCHLVATRDYKENSFHLRDLRTWQIVQTVSEPGNNLRQETISPDGKYIAYKVNRTAVKIIPTAHKH